MRQFSCWAAAGALLLHSGFGHAATSGVAISEWMYNPVGSPGEFVELTNFGPTAVDFANWSFDDNTEQPGSESLAAFGIVQPGQSVVFTEAAADAFRSAWGLSAGVEVIGGITNNLGRSDEINIYNGNTLVDRLTFNDQGSGSVKGPRTQGTSGRPGSAAVIGTNNASGWVLSAVGDVEGAWKSTGGDIGSPGRTSFHVSAVPEPASGALFGAGFVLLAAASRRRQPRQ